MLVKLNESQRSILISSVDHKKMMTIDQTERQQNFPEAGCYRSYLLVSVYLLFRFQFTRA